MARRILFLCTGNTARSQMAEALLRKKAGNVFEASSAGTDPKEEIFPPAIEVMKEIGIDISGQRPKGVDGFLGRVHFEKAIIVCADAKKNARRSSDRRRGFFGRSKIPSKQRAPGKISWPSAAKSATKSTERSPNG